MQSKFADATLEDGAGEAAIVIRALRREREPAGTRGEKAGDAARKADRGLSTRLDAKVEGARHRIGTAPLIHNVDSDCRGKCARILIEM